VRELERSRRGDASSDARGDAPSTSGNDQGTSSATEARAGGDGGRRVGVGLMSRGAPAPAPTRGGVFAPSDLLTSSHMHAGGVVRQRHPDIDEVTRATTRVGDVLLKHEEREIETLNAYAAVIEAEESNAYEGASTPPCDVEAANVRACYSAHAQDVTECRKFVDAYKKCGRVALRSFVSQTSQT